MTTLSHSSRSLYRVDLQRKAAALHDLCRLPAVIQINVSTTTCALCSWNWPVWLIETGIRLSTGYPRISPKYAYADCPISCSGLENTMDYPSWYRILHTQTTTLKAGVERSQPKISRKCKATHRARINLCLYLKHGLILTLDSPPLMCCPTFRNLRKQAENLVLSCRGHLYSGSSTAP